MRPAAQRPDEPDEVRAGWEPRPSQVIQVFGRLEVYDVGSPRTRIIKSQLVPMIRRARAVARERDREIAGVLVSYGGVIGLVQLANVSRRRGHFEIRREHIRATNAAARKVGGHVVGTWHSHVLGLAQPGAGDIAGASDGDLMLVIDTLVREARLWRIHNGRAYGMEFIEI